MESDKKKRDAGRRSGRGPDSGVHARPRAVAFVRRLVSSYRRAFGADPLGFIETHFGARFAQGDARPPSLDTTYRRQGRAVLSTPRTSFTRYALTLRVTQFVQDFHFWLSQLLRQDFHRFRSSRLLRAEGRPAPRAGRAWGEPRADSRAQHASAPLPLL
ncbi:MAG: hypothetical protein M3416_14400, partial [Acidobacteriota bacterium]|nr:hypothetical protein [Acidobacteriota bacterium]